MDPVSLLKEVNLFANNKTALDVGTKNGELARRLVEYGMSVDAIDINSPASEISGVNFKQISVEDFLADNKKNYDIVIAKHVLHYLDNPKQAIKELNNIAKIFLFTCFGPKDDWANQVSVLSHEEVMSMFDERVIKHRSEAFQYGKTYSGDVKFWHINTFVIDNRNS